MFYFYFLQIQPQVIERTARVDLTLYEGKGVVKITAPEGEFDITYFGEIRQRFLFSCLPHISKVAKFIYFYFYFFIREQLLAPFKIVDSINKYDIHMECNHGGMSCIARAARLAISQALCSFVTIDQIEKLRIGKNIQNYGKKAKNASQ
jgi:hypothetical protein